MTVASSPIDWVTRSAENKLVLNPSDYSHVGLTTINIYVDDGHSKNSYTTTITVINQAPKYTAPHTYAAKTMHLGSTEKVTIPSYSDPDNFQPVTVTVSDSHAYPITATVTQTDFSVNPTLFDMVGIHTLTITLSDGD